MPRTKAKPKRWASRRRSRVIVKRRFTGKRPGKPLMRAAKRARLHIGTGKPMTSLSKTRVSGPHVSNKSTRTLYQRNLTSIPFGSLVNERARNTVRIKGFKIKYVVRNLQPTQNVIMRIAVVSPNSVTVPIETDFLKGYGTDKGINLGVALSGIENTTHAINTREYTVLWQSKIHLGAGLNSATAITTNGNAERKISKWVPLNRTLEWDSAVDAEAASSNCWLVYWFDLPLEAAGAAVITGAVLSSYEVVTYFDDNN